MGNHQTISSEGDEEAQPPLQPRDVRMSDSDRMQVVVSHYTPPNFPLIPLINPDMTQVCKESWKIIMDSSFEEHGVTTTGVTAFYNEFYERLAMIDTAGKIDEVLLKSIGRGAMNKLALKGEILLRIVKFILGVECDDKPTREKLKKLGQSHVSRGIRPYQYAVFINVLIQTISSRLETAASNVVMEAWVNLFAYVIRGMLPYAIKNQVDEREIFINTSKTFSTTANMTKEEIEILKGKKIRRYIKTHVMSKSDA